MQTQQINSRQIDSNFKMSSKTFTIQATAKAFEILSDKLYKNKIKAVIRELCCNAYDSHVVAGKKAEPFKVHIPSKLEPYFEVEDFGIGMSEETVMELYSAYFFSDKTASNELVGALGLGSKSPFAYTNTFIVTSIFDGIETDYVAMLNDRGEPSISKIKEDLTEKPNGVKVNLAVNQNDFDEFKSEATDVLTYFNTKPIIENAVLNFKDALSGAYLTGEGYIVYNKENDRYYNYDHTVVQGNVAYPIEKSKFKSYAYNNSEKFSGLITNTNPASKRTVSEVLEAFSSIGMMLMVPIGTVDVAPSREELNYCDYTIENLIKQYVIAYNDLMDKAMIKIKSVSSIAEFVQYMFELSVSVYASLGNFSGYSREYFFRLIKAYISHIDVGDTIELSQDSSKEEINKVLKKYIFPLYPLIDLDGTQFTDLNLLPLRRHKVTRGKGLYQLHSSVDVLRSFYSDKGKVTVLINDYPETMKRPGYFNKAKALYENTLVAEDMLLGGIVYVPFNYSHPDLEKYCDVYKLSEIEVEAKPRKARTSTKVETLVIPQYCLHALDDYVYIDRRDTKLDEIEYYVYTKDDSITSFYVHVHGDIEKDVIVNTTSVKDLIHRVYKDGVIPKDAKVAILTKKLFKFKNIKLNTTKVNLIPTVLKHYVSQYATTLTSLPKKEKMALLLSQGFVLDREANSDSRLTRAITLFSNHPASANIPEIATYKNMTLDADFTNTDIMANKYSWLKSFFNCLHHEMTIIGLPKGIKYQAGVLTLDDPVLIRETEMRLHELSLLRDMILTNYPLLSLILSKYGWEEDIENVLDYMTAKCYYAGNKS